MLHLFTINLHMCTHFCEMGLLHIGESKTHVWMVNGGNNIVYIIFLNMLFRFQWVLLRGSVVMLLHIDTGNGLSAVRQYGIT